MSEFINEMHNPKNSGFYLDIENGDRLSLIYGNGVSPKQLPLSIEQTKAGEYQGWIEKVDMQQFLDSENVYLLESAAKSDVPVFEVLDSEGSRIETDNSSLARLIAERVRSGEEITIELSPIETDLLATSTVRKIDVAGNLSPDVTALSDELQLTVFLYIEQSRVAELSSDGRYVYLEDIPVYACGNLLNYGGELGVDEKEIFCQLDDSDDKQVYCDVALDSETNELKIFSVEIRQTSK